MGTYTLPTKRKIHLVQYAMKGTYLGQMEGNRESLTPSIRENIPERASSLLSPAKPLVIIDSGETPLLNWFCVAHLKSYQPARSSDPDFMSELYVAWFMENTAKPVDDIIVSLLPHIDWETQASDYDLMF